MDNKKGRKKSIQPLSFLEVISLYKWVIGVVVAILLVLGGVGIYKSSQNESSTPTSNKISKVENKGKLKEKSIKKKTNEVTVRVTGN